ncbi:hypothetical protein K504DRAFT_461571 [Pleomassaria siparia CBS 279.74]|uniref:Uncharacterized protein n=1 Tax=Pleomassaria siparia CBS 279.74 TaxID=1314801 RepID=A0A6G1KJH0_9PLEO|nr:hypothetical protein K504DRAFT_461571 [Pleomassaria siparia CBS 279.74]
MLHASCEFAASATRVRKRRRYLFVYTVVTPWVLFYTLYPTRPDPTRPDLGDPDTSLEQPCLVNPPPTVFPTSSNNHV